MGYLKPFKRKDKIGFRDADKVIIHAAYDCYRRQGNYLLCGRGGKTASTGIYDLFTRYGDFLFGGFNEFEETDSHFLFLLNGEWKRQIGYEDDWGQNRIYDWFFHDENACWLALDKDLLSVKRGEHGERIQFKKGFKVEIDHKKEGHDTIDFFNFDIELLTEEKPFFSGNYMLTSDLEMAQAIRLSDGASTAFYDVIRHCSDSLFFICRNGQLGVASFDNKVMLLGEYFAFTYPVNGFAFAFKYIDGNNCRVDLLCVHYTSIGPVKTVVASKPLKEIVQYILRGYFKIMPKTNGIGEKSISVLRPSIFDEPFSLKIAQEKNIKFQYGFKDMYWFSNNCQLDPEQQDGI